ncbi:uncharacterized protein LOC127867420 isoform X2 [Dreissena polymorpha]|uniref:uncharacterized protein LOC127867420 isoform X2 n=1 Tax=Dreissena polymorpha TaxID=45954 RepID=UPI002263DE9E|nr:uncharacterized protein LOC127867420 isoform X2 [Dreissena polymorpha]
MKINEQTERETRGNEHGKEICMTAGSIYAYGTLLFTLSGAFLVLVGFVMPYWVTFDYKPCISNRAYEVTVYVSIWYCMVCDMDKPTYCRMKGITLHPGGTFKFSQLSGCDAEELAGHLASGMGDFQLWTPVPIVTSFGLGMIFVAAIMVEVWRCAGYSNKKFVTAICCFLFVGGVAVLSMVILVSIGVARSFDVPNKENIKVGTFQWSILTSGIGSLVVLAGGVLAAIEVCSWREPAKRGNDFDNVRNIEPGSSSHANPGFTGDVPDRDTAYSFYSGTHDNHGSPRDKAGYSAANSRQRFADSDNNVGREGAYVYLARSIDNNARPYYASSNQRFTDNDVVKGDAYGNYGRSSSAHSKQRFTDYDVVRGDAYSNYGMSSSAHSHQRVTGYDVVRGDAYGNYGRSSSAHSHQRVTGYDAGRGGSYGNYGRRPGVTGQAEHRNYREPTYQADVVYSKPRHISRFNL